MKFTVSTTKDGMPRVDWQFTDVIYREPPSGFSAFMDAITFVPKEVPDDAYFTRDGQKFYYRKKRSAYAEVQIVNGVSNILLQSAIHDQGANEEILGLAPPDYISAFLLMHASQRKTNYHGPDYYVIVADIGTGVLIDVAKHYGTAHDAERIRATLVQKFITERPARGWTGFMPSDFLLDYFKIPACNPALPASSSTFDDDDPI